MAPVVPIPRRPADVTSERLSAVLAADVKEVDVAPIGTGQTGATYRVSATYATERDLPGTFAIQRPAARSPNGGGGARRSARPERVRSGLAWAVRHLDAQAGRRGGGEGPR